VKASRLEHELIEGHRRLVEALCDSIGALRRAWIPFDPAAPGEWEERSKGIIAEFVTVFGNALSDLRFSGVLKKLEQVDDAATLAHYRKEHDDPQERRIAYDYAKLIIETNPIDCQRLTKLVREALDEPGLRGTWEWLSILLKGLTGQLWLVTKGEEANPAAGPPREDLHSHQGHEPDYRQAITAGTASPPSKPLPSEAARNDNPQSIFDRAARRLERLKHLKCIEERLQGKRSRVVEAIGRFSTIIPGPNRREERADALLMLCQTVRAEGFTLGIESILDQGREDAGDNNRLAIELYHLAGADCGKIVPQVCLTYDDAMHSSER